MLFRVDIYGDMDQSATATIKTVNKESSLLELFGLDPFGNFNYKPSFLVNELKFFFCQIYPNKESKLVINSDDIQKLYKARNVLVSALSFSYEQNWSEAVKIFKEYLDVADDIIQIDLFENNPNFLDYYYKC